MNNLARATRFAQLPALPIFCHHPAKSAPELLEYLPAGVRWPQGLWLGYQEELLKIFRMLDDNNNGVMDFSELLVLGEGVSASFSGTDATAPSDRHPKAAMIQENRHDDGTRKE